MANSSNTTPRQNPLDRPGLSVPSVYSVGSDAEAHARRISAIKGDKATHRMYHALYEDMLN